MLVPARLRLVGGLAGANDAGVFLVEERATSRRLVLKVVGEADAAEREALAELHVRLAEFEHPSLVPIEEIGRMPGNGLVYHLTPLVAGEAIATRHASGRLPAALLQPIASLLG